MEALPSLVGGHFYRLSWLGRIHGLAVWSPTHFPRPVALSLPASRLPGRLPRRRAQIIQMGEITLANVHLSHGQLLNRRQLARVAAALQGKPSAIIGDYNAVGPMILPGFADVGPREPTHLSGNVMPVRLDRCLAHGLGLPRVRCARFRPVRPSADQARVAPRRPSRRARPVARPARTGCAASTGRAAAAAPRCCAGGSAAGRRRYRPAS